MRVAVAVCTRDRAAVLRRCLERMAACAFSPDATWEVLVVNNGSRDETDAVALACPDRLRVRLVHEPRPGLSLARNRALESAAGDYIVWIDDDVLVEPGWLEAYVTAFRRWPTAAVFGGPIAPRFEGELPAWLAQTLPYIGGIFGARDLGPEPVPLTPALDRMPFGGNFALRLAEVGQRRFDPQLGRSPRRPSWGGEETEFLGRLLADGATGWWVPNARVEHCVPGERQTLAYVRAQFSADAESARWRGRRGRASVVAHLGALRRAVVAEGVYWIARLVRPPDCWVPRLAAAGERWGALRGMLRDSRQGRHDA